MESLLKPQATGKNCRQSGLQIKTVNLLRKVWHLGAINLSKRRRLTVISWMKRRFLLKLKGQSKPVEITASNEKLKTPAVDKGTSNPNSGDPKTDNKGTPDRNSNGDPKGHLKDTLPKPVIETASFRS